MHLEQNCSSFFSCSRTLVKSGLTDWTGSIIFKGIRDQKVGKRLQVSGPPVPPKQSRGKDAAIVATEAADKQSVELLLVGAPGARARAAPR